MGWAKVENSVNDLLAKETLETLHQLYPGHPWFVFIGGGVMQIKNLTFSRSWGMVLKLRNIHQDAGERKRKVIMAAGEFLERANLKRGGNTGEKATRVDGIPQKDFGR